MPVNKAVLNHSGMREKSGFISVLIFRMRQSRDEAVRVALDLQKKDLTNSLKRDFDKDLARLEGEVLSLKQVSPSPGNYYSFLLYVNYSFFFNL